MSKCRIHVSIIMSSINDIWWRINITCKCTYKILLFTTRNKYNIHKYMRVHYIVRYHTGDVFIGIIKHDVCICQ